MNAISQLFKIDIPNTFLSGKIRVNIKKLKNKNLQLENQKKILLTNLGNKAWEAKVFDESFSDLIKRLEDLDISINKVEQETNVVQINLNQEIENFAKTNSLFETQLNSIQSQKQISFQKLRNIQSLQNNLEKQLAHLQLIITQGPTNIQNLHLQINQLTTSNLADKENRIASINNTIENVTKQIVEAEQMIPKINVDLDVNKIEQNPIRSEIEEYNQQIIFIQKQNKSESDVIKENQKNFQVKLLALKEKLKEINNQKAELMPEFGHNVYKTRPISEVLLETYTRIDDLQKQIADINDQINLSTAQLSPNIHKSVKRVAFAIGGLVFVLIVIIGFGIGGANIIPKVLNAFKPDPKVNISLVKTWTLQNCNIDGANGGILDVSVWENKKKDSVAIVEFETVLNGANDIILDSFKSTNVQLAPGALTVNLSRMNPKGSRVISVERTINSVFFTPTSATRPKNIEVTPHYEKSQFSKNNALRVDITNKSDFGLMPIDFNIALVINSKDELIDILGAPIENNQIQIDTKSKYLFQGIAQFENGCLKSNYSQEEVTYWYFIPLQIGTAGSDIFTISGKEKFTP